MEKLTLSKPEDIETFLDPFRSKIIRILRSRHEPMTVTEIADFMGVTPAKVHYHVKKLESIGVLAVKFTKLVNGITAKYYDMTSDTIALSVSDNDEKSDLLQTLALRQYGALYDEAKQKFYDLYIENRAPGDPERDACFYFMVQDALPVDADRMEELYAEIKTLVNKYRSEKEGSDSYFLFFTAVKNQE